MSTSPLAIGGKVGDTWSQYRLDAVEVQTAAATVYRATSLQDRCIAHHPDDTVSDVIFVVVLHHPLEPSIADSLERWPVAKKLMRQAMTLVSPVAAGFPEWNKIRQDDPVRLDHGELDGIHWSAFQISTYRRRVARASAAGRKPHMFSTAQRTSLLKIAGNECWRCGST
ncbi:MAG: hypothetical protein M3457_12355, partial [Chloroflexota bacterium]|nr:hypothetical protein [Chloroflexota bacterium]